jgi:hypothetical protein
VLATESGVVLSGLALNKIRTCKTANQQVLIYVLTFDTHKPQRDDLGGWAVCGIIVTIPLRQMPSEDEGGALNLRLGR